MNNSKSTFSKYGAIWPREMDELMIEVECIKRGGKWIGSKGQDCGLGLFDHYMNFRHLVWPERYRHRWTDLIYKNYIENQIMILMGPASSQKTSGAVECVLIDYWCFPNDTLVLLSTTKIEKLEMGVFGEMKMLWEKGHTRYPWLCGNVLDNKHAITTDNLKDDGVRDMRKGVVGRALYQGSQYVGLGHWAGIKQKKIRFVGDELQFCFTKGQLVDTPKGQVPIEDVKTGDLVLSATGLNRVKMTMSHIVDSLVKIKTKDGREITCTPNHRFFTQLGWIKACNLSEEHYMLSAYETMQILQDPIRASETSTDLRQVLGGTNKNLFVLQGTFSGQRKHSKGEMLQHELLREVDARHSGLSSQDLYARTERKSLGIQKEMVGNSGSGRNEGESFASNENEQSDAQSHFLPQVRGENTRYGDLPYGSGRQWHGANQGRMATDEDVSRGIEQLSYKNRNESRKRVSNMLQSGLGASGCENSHRGRRRLAFKPEAQGAGYKENKILRGSWVASVTLQKQADIRPEFPNSDNERCRVYNLSVEGHPSYSVNGLVAHNCNAGFLDVLPNMMGSTDVDAQGNPDFKFVGSGNPKHDPYDQLSVIAEPDGGWLSLGDIKKTTVWKLKGFEKGVCINLIGSDSPNFDVPEGSPEPFPRLISRAFIKMVEKRWGKGSMKWYSQCEGKMMMNMVGNRVITKELCERHGAFNPVVWKDENQTRIAFLDPAWAGQNADRCVFGWLDYGFDVTDKLVMSFGQYMVIPFPPNSRTEPDDIIAQFVQAQCKANEIKPENVFYDSSGKGTTGAALARVFGDRVPVPIYFGGNPTARPVRHDLFVTEKNGEKRLKRCDEEYKKFVTELWFSSRNVIECGQMRNLPQEVAHEGCLREYADAPGGKIEIEKKEDTRERMGMSPDLYDAFVCGVEGARQLGFKIERLGEEIIESPENDPDYFEREAREYEQAIKSGLPQHI